jgi:AcrR family transcriptional regulator
VTQSFEITPRKRPTQARAMPTFDALVEACARLLPELGYDKLTTNAVAERAGASIGSLYEYFPGKDAIIAVVVERMVERVMGRLDKDLDVTLAEPVEGSMQRWIARVYDIIEAERPLVRVLLNEVPYTRKLDVVKALPQQLLEFSERGRIAARIEMPEPAAALFLINNLVSTTILQILLEPPSGVSKEDVIRMLSAHVSDLFEKR